MCMNAFSLCMYVSRTDEWMDGCVCIHIYCGWKDARVYVYNEVRRRVVVKRKRAIVLCLMMVRCMNEYFLSMYVCMCVCMCVCMYIMLRKRPIVLCLMMVRYVREYFLSMYVCVCACI